MEYISVKEASALWGIDVSNIGKLCRKGKIEGAKIVGRNWLIPSTASRPADGRTRAAKEQPNATVFRFPLYVNFSEDSFLPPLSAEETKLRRAQVDCFSCEFQKAKSSFEELCGHAENIYVKICALFFMCVLSAEYDCTIRWEKYYYEMNLLLSADFPHKKEMELLLPLLDFITGRFGEIAQKLNTDSTYEYHPSAWYLNAFLAVFNYDRRDTETANTNCTEPFGMLCQLMERDGHFFEAQELHMILFVHHYGTHNEEAMQYHLQKAIRLAYEHDLLFTIADAETYYGDVINAILCDYPDSFSDRIRKNSKRIYDNFSVFAKKISKTNVYERLSESDYRYIFYAIEGFTNRQVAGFCNVSERTVAKKYNDIYDKVGVNSKAELMNEMAFAFGKNR